jgi:hypothetical protein
MQEIAFFLSKNVSPEFPKILPKLAEKVKPYRPKTKNQPVAKLEKIKGGTLFFGAS